MNLEIQNYLVYTIVLVALIKFLNQSGLFFTNFFTKKKFYSGGYFPVILEPVQNVRLNLSQFNQKYWDSMYAEDDESIIDGIHNAKEIYKVFKKGFRIRRNSSPCIGDFGFGKGIS